MMAEDQQAYPLQHNKCTLATVLTGKSTLTSVPSSKDTRQVMIDFASPAAGMCVVARWASLNRVFSACFRMERRPSVLRRKLSMMGEEGGSHYHTWKRREQHLQNLKQPHRKFILCQFWKLKLCFSAVPPGYRAVSFHNHSAIISMTGKMLNNDAAFPLSTYDKHTE